MSDGPPPFDRPFDDGEDGKVTYDRDDYERRRVNELAEEHTADELQDRIDDLIDSMHRLHRIDRDTTDAELEMQTLIEQEFESIDESIDALDSRSK